MARERNAAPEGFLGLITGFGTATALSILETCTESAMPVWAATGSAERVTKKTRIHRNADQRLRRQARNDREHSALGYWPRVQKLSSRKRGAKTRRLGENGFASSLRLCPAVAGRAFSFK